MNRKILGIFIMTLLITIATLPIVSAVPILDQRQEKCDGEKFIPNLAWQEFIPTMKILREVEVKVTQWYGGSPNLKLSIEQPLGTVLTFRELPVSDIPSGTAGWVNFDVPDYTLTPGQKYYITLTYPPGGEYSWCAGNGDPYVSGESSGPADEDFCFRTWANKGKSKNSIDIEAEWSNPLSVSMPKNKSYIINSLFLQFLENHPQVQNTIMNYNSNNLGNLFSQLPLGPNDPDKEARTSDVGLGWKVHDDFWAITEPICDIHWWGFTMFWTGSGWDTGNPAGMTFDITFYTDIGGQPGNVVCYYPGITYSATSTGIMYDWGINWELYIFEANLNPCCSMSNGWVSIESTFSPSNYLFLWMNSKDGNLQSLQNSNTLSFDFSFILTGNDPPTTPLINGPANGKAGTSYTYTFTSTDPNGDQIQYYIDWDDGTPPTWSVLQASGAPYSVSHIWTGQGSYVIKAKTKDTLNAESGLSSYPITMPKNKAINTPFLNFLENHPHLFPLLRQLLRL